MNAVIVMDAEAIDAERERLLKSTSLTVEELRERSSSYSLTPREQGILDQIEDLDYLADAG